MLLGVTVCALMMCIGYKYHDWYMKKVISKACIRSIGTDDILVGNSVDHIKCLAILTDDEIHRVFDEMKD